MMIPFLVKSVGSKRALAYRICYVNSLGKAKIQEDSHISIAEINVGFSFCNRVPLDL